MDQRAALVVLVVLATLQVSQGKTSFPDYWLEEQGPPVVDGFSQAGSWAASTRWLAALRSSYSQILRFENEETLRQTMDFAANIGGATQMYKDQIEEIFDEVDKPNYVRCTEDNKFDKILEVIVTEYRDLQECVSPIKTLLGEYKRALENLTAEVEATREETIYSHCLEADPAVRLDDGAETCFNTSLQEALRVFYYPLGSTLLHTVTDYRRSIAHAQTQAQACAVAATHAQSVSRDLEATTSCLNPSRQRVRRGFGKKFKKFFKKAKKGIKKVCSKVPCQVGVSLPFG